ncbi:lipopolysaccharide biosynthesis protein [Arthrobacter burdickii]|uniref:Oligosaccharide flippase family protein n=1 Tax=Arthrobacter burdickii TaxID=3035920 RepID=A0ABT8K6D0_9MICC|nr:oligosaccharide flippase family protein [Arthrobacter burdickii]MDN4612583.1 oligosaccharide flippase family protein [Arthrobacter burdickii]
MSLRSGAGLGRDAFLMTLGRYGQFGVTLITLPIIARSLSVAEFGVYAVGSGLYFLGSIFTDWGLSLPLGAKERSIGEIESRALRGDFLTFRLISVLLVVVILGATVVLGGSGVLALAFLAGCVSSLGEEWLLTARGKFLSIIYCQWVGRAFYLAVVFFVLPFRESVVVPFIGLLGGAVLSTVLSWRSVGRPRVADASGYSAIWSLLRLGLPSVMAKVLTNMSGTSVSVLLSMKFPLQVIGVFSGSDRLVRAGVSALDSVVVAQFPRIASDVLVQGYSWKIFARVCGLALLCGTVACGGLWACAPLIEKLLYADALPGVVDVLRVASFLIPASALVSTINTNVFSVQQRTGPMLTSAAAAAAVLVGMLGFAPPSSSAVYVAGCVVVSEWCGALVALGLAIRSLRRYHATSFVASP